MKNILFAFALIISQYSLGQKNNIFIAAEVAEELGVSFTYNRLVDKKLGLGVTVEVLNATERSTGDWPLSLLAEARYFINFGKSSLFPLMQAGRYMYFYEANISNNPISIRGGFHGAIGVGYSYSIHQGFGPFIGLKYRSISVHSEINNKRTTTTGDDVVATFGLRMPF